ncbi:hypothetical protein NQ315_017179 [Exocentrus adspersus]|uniref:Luciferin 4-monooxygenase n=1 Tax=Exocentrus adspersus TaxID=1586481 RepID=A0AAV8VH92_9CUCU|nr:hypothetical protein NQ315_017179 [Exocentrus adspersus]
MFVLRRLLFKKQYVNNLRTSVCSLSTNSQEDVNIIRSPHNDIDIPNATITEFLYSRMENYHKYTATVCAETGRSYTFEQLRIKSRNLSKALRKILKLEKGDTVALLLPNLPEFPICVFGPLEAGLIVTTINPLYTAEEISRQLLDSSAKAIITLVSSHETAKSALILSKRKIPIVTIKSREDQNLPQGAISFNELIDNTINIPDIPPGSPDDIAILPYSSGTTGLPKGVLLTHRNIVSNTCQVTCPGLDISIKPTDSYQDIIPAVLPMFHIYGLTVGIFGSAKNGSRQVCLRRFTPELYISVLKNYKITLIYAAPPLVLFLTLHSDVKMEYLEHVRVVTSGAAPLGALDEERFLQKAPKSKMVQGYGLTETSPVVTMCTVKLFDQGKGTGSIGQVVPNTETKFVAIDDPTGKPLGPNQSGELLVKGPQVMRGYHNRPEETKNAFQNGWFRTGDLGHYNEHQVFFLTDRLKELIKVRGFQVAPAELEEIIRDFSAVEDAAVIGVPDDINGELPRAYVVPKKGKPLKEQDLVEYVAKKVAPYKQLKGGIEIVDAIPKNAAGKILRRQLKLKYMKATILSRSARGNNAKPLAAVISNRRNSTRPKITSDLPDVDIPKVPLNEYVFEHASKWGNLTASECAVTGRKYTYNEFRRKSKNFAGSLRKKLKLERGDVIAILLPNIPEYPIVVLGALQAGIISTTMNPIYTPAEISRQLLDSSTKVIVTLNELWPVANATKNLTKRDIPIVTINSQQGQATPVGAINFSELTEEETDFSGDSETSPEDVALLPYSSGTTGLPKGVQLTHSNIVANLCQIEHPLIGCNFRTTAEHQDTTQVVLPLFHIYGLTILCLYQLRLGCKIVTLPKFTPELYIGALRKHKSEVLYLAPPIAIFLANHPSIKDEDFKHVRTIVSGAAALGILDEAKLMKKANRQIPLLQGYGLTETSPAILSTRACQLNNKKMVGSLGQPVPNTEVKIISIDNPTATNLGPNEIGELIVKGPQVMKGYLNRPEENIFIGEWMRTGDMMYYNEDGFLFITDRLKELIKVKGFQVAPAELEEIIRDFPDVVDAAVIGIPHGSHGEVPRAYVVARQGTKINEEKLKEFVNSKVAPYKQIRGGVALVDDIPKNAAGKTLRRELKQLYEKEKRV